MSSKQNIIYEYLTLFQTLETDAKFELMDTKSGESLFLSSEQLLEFAQTIPCIKR